MRALLAAALALALACARGAAADDFRVACAGTGKRLSVCDGAAARTGALTAECDAPTLTAGAAALQLVYSTSTSSANTELGAYENITLGLRLGESFTVRLGGDWTCGECAQADRTPARVANSSALRCVPCASGITWAFLAEDASEHVLAFFAWYRKTMTGAVYEAVYPGALPLFDNCTAALQERGLGHGACAQGEYVVARNGSGALVPRTPAECMQRRRCDAVAQFRAGICMPCEHGVSEADAKNHPRYRLDVAHTCTCEPGTELQHDGTCRACTQGTYKTALGPEACSPCSVPAEQRRACTGEVSARCACEGTEPAAVPVAQSCPVLERRCPATFAQLNAFFQAHALEFSAAYEGVPCWLVIETEEGRMQKQENYYFNRTLLCVEPRPTDAVTLVENTLYLERSTCAAGQRALPRKAWLDTECEACPAGTYQDAEGHRESECKPRDTCTGVEYDSAPLRVAQAHCVSDMADGEIPLPNASAPRLAFSDARRTAFSFSQPKLNPPCGGIFHTASVLESLWKRGAFRLPPASAASVRGMETLLSSDPRNGRCLLACNRGYAYNGDEPQCSACASGKYKWEHGGAAVLHTLAADGNLQHVPCRACPAGSYALSRGSTACLACPVGYYCPAGTVNPLPCEAPDTNLVDGCNKALQFLTGPCGPGTGAINCAPCPLNKTLNQQTWSGWGPRAHCDLRCDAGSRLSADADNVSQWKCVACDPDNELACGGACRQGFRLPAGAGDDGGCVQCLDDSETFAEVCGGAHVAATLDASCPYGVGARCVPCPAPPNSSLVAVRNAEARTCRYECNGRLRGGARYVPFAEAARLLEFGPDGRASEAELGGCVRTRVLAREECPAQVARLALDGDVRTVECAEAADCTGLTFVVALRGASDGNPVCACTSGMYGENVARNGGGQCRVCPEGMTSLVGTAAVEGCFCRPGWAPVAAGTACVPCGSGEGGRSGYCPGGFANYTRDVLPHLLQNAEHPGELAGSRCHNDSTMPADTGVCACPAGLQAAAAMYADSVTACDLQHNMRIGAGGGIEACPVEPYAVFVSGYAPCSTQCVNGAVRDGEGVCACDSPGGYTAESQDTEQCVCRPGWARMGGAPEQPCRRCLPGTFCTGGEESAESCGQDKTSKAGATQPADCRCRPGYRYAFEQGNAPRFYVCLLCESNIYCQPNCNTTDAGDTNVLNLGACTCPEHARCPTTSYFYPEACEPGKYAVSVNAACESGYQGKLWINNLQCEPLGQCTVHNPEFSEGEASVLRNMNTTRYDEYKEPGLFLLAAAARYCSVGHALVLARTGSAELAGECLFAGVRIHSAGAVPLVRDVADTDPLLLRHEVVRGEVEGRLTRPGLHLAWNLVLQCAVATADAERAWSELSVCHTCRTGRVVLQAAAGPGGTLGDATVLGAGGAAYWPSASAYPVLGLPLGEACVGAVVVAGPSALRHEILCTQAGGGVLAHKAATNGVLSEVHRAGLAYVWLAVLPPHWQLEPARAHGTHTVLVVACRADGTGALLVQDFSNNAWPVHALELRNCGGHCCGANASRAAPAHVLERAGAALYVLASGALLRIPLDAYALNNNEAVVQVVLGGLPGGEGAVYAGAWLARAPSAMQADKREAAALVFVRVHGAAGAAPAQQLRVYEWSVAGDAHGDVLVYNRTLLTSDALDQALALELGERPVRALWSPYNGTRAALGPLAVLNSEEADDQGRSRWPLHVLAQVELHNGGRSLRAALVLQFENATAPVRVRVVRVLQRPELRGAVLALAYVPVPVRVHSAHANVLAVAGRALAVHMHSTSLRLVLDVAAFGCFECEAHERWDPSAQRCACLPGSLAACLPCIEGSACDPHRTVYSPEAAGCVILNDLAGAVYEERCLPCGVSAPFFCLHERPLACPVGEYAHTASGLAAGVEACHCAPGLTRGGDGGCARCVAPAVCAPPLSARGIQFACPRDTELDDTRKPSFACGCRDGLREEKMYDWAFERDARWPLVQRVSGGSVSAAEVALLQLAHANVSISVAECVPCPLGQYCTHGQNKSCLPGSRPAPGQTHCECEDGYSFDANTQQCEPCPHDQVCVWDGAKIAVHPCGGSDPAWDATGLAALCPCSAFDNMAQVFSPGRGCQRCRKGHYCPQLSPPPQKVHREHPCPPNSSAPEGSRNVEACACAPGSELRAGACAPCTRNTYSSSDIAGCIPCPDNATASVGASSLSACRCPEHQEMGTDGVCRCREGTLQTADRGCRICDDPRVETAAPNGADVEKCTHCRPGFWRTTEVNMNKYQCMRRSKHNVSGHPYAREARAAWRQFDALYPALAASDKRCVLCPPGFACYGGESAPAAFDQSMLSFQLVPAGLKSHTVGWRACPHMRTHRAPRGLSGVGFGSCVLEADTWGAQQQPPHVAALGKFGAVAGLTIDTQVHDTRLLNMLLDARTVPADSDLMPHFVDAETQFVWLRESHTRFVFYFEIDVVNMTYRYHDELHAAAESLGAHNDSTGADAAALLPAVWALHHARAHDSRNGEPFVPVSSLVHNDVSASGVHNVLAHAAQALSRTTLPQVRFLVAQAQLVAPDSSVYLAQRGGLAYVHVQSATAVLLAQYAAQVPAAQAPVVSAYAQLATPTILHDVLEPSLDIACPTGTTSASEQGARACAACAENEYYDAGHAVCRACASYTPEQCWGAMRNSPEPFACGWQHDASCGVCMESGCCDPAQLVIQLGALLLGAAVDAGGVP